MYLEKSLVHKIIDKTLMKINQHQNGVTTFFDNLILQQGEAFLKDNKYDSEILERVLEIVTITGDRRFVNLSDRLINMPVSSLDNFSRVCSQGVHNVFCWQGKPLFKSAYDLAIYHMMISEIRPATIIEIGSTEASLCWLKDITDLNNLGVRIIGIDQIQPRTLPKDVEFRRGDIGKIDYLLTACFIETLPRPFLIIEDAHVHLKRVLQYLGFLMLEGDYLMIEDSILKQDELKEWSLTQKNILVDTFYTDFYGINGTSAVNSILVKKEANNAYA
ncbi:CmcI family methyltransferase [Bacillus inaquosorum]|uniref:CmcI family methyltransferase n=1 Tax=Bacillus sp. 0209A TaxID=3120562 RepID=UPI002FD99486